MNTIESKIVYAIRAGFHAHHPDAVLADVGNATAAAMDMEMIRSNGSVENHHLVKELTIAAEIFARDSADALHEKLARRFLASTPGKKERDNVLALVEAARSTLRQLSATASDQDTHEILLQALRNALSPFNGGATDGPIEFGK